MNKKQSEINSTTRWLADSAFTTYFGKPAFHAYGKGNVKPTNSNSKYLTHNVNPACGSYKLNKKTKEYEVPNCHAEFQQVYDSALMAGINKTKEAGGRVPKLPRTKQEEFSD